MEKLGKGELAPGRWAGPITALMGGFVARLRSVVGGGNAKRVKELPPRACGGGHKPDGVSGAGSGWWSVEDAWVLAAPGGEVGPSRRPRKRSA